MRPPLAVKNGGGTPHRGLNMQPRAAPEGVDGDFGDAPGQADGGKPGASGKRPARNLLQPFFRRHCFKGGAAGKGLLPHPAERRGEMEAADAGAVPEGPAAD